MKQTDQLTAQRLRDGFEALNRGQLDVAASACEQVLAENPDLAAAHFLVGLIAVEGDERRVAHKAFKSVLKLDRDHAAAWAQLARLNASEGRIASAEEALKEVRRIQPTDPAVLDLTGSFEFFYEDERGGSWEANPEGYIDAFTIANLRVGYESDNNWYVQAYVENVFDEFTWDGYNANGGILPSHFFGPMRPTTIGIRAGMSWD